MKNIQLFGSVVLLLAIALVLFLFLSSIGNKSCVVEPEYVVKEGAVLFSLDASMQQNRKLDVRYQYAKGLLIKVGGNLLNSMKNKWFDDGLHSHL